MKLVDKFSSHRNHIDNSVRIMQTTLTNSKMDTMEINLKNYYEVLDGTPYAETGYDLAKQLHTMGYTKLILCSGEEPQGEIPEYLHVVRKNDLHSDKSMGKI